MDSYIFLKDIQDFLISHEERFHQKVTIPDAILYLYNAGKTSPTAPTDTLSRILAWQGSDFKKLQKIFLDDAIDVTYRIKTTDKYYSMVDEKNFFFPTDRDSVVLLLLTNEASALHQHDYFEIDYVLENSCDLFFESEKHTLGCGEFCIISPYTKHDIQVERDSIVFCISIRKSTFENVFFNILKEDNILSSFFNNCLYNSSRNYLRFMMPPSEHIIWIFKNIILESLSTKPCANEVCNSYMTLLFSELIRNYSSTYSYYKPIHGANIQIPAILAYIKANLSHTNLTDVAAFFHYNPSYLGKQIRANTGMYFNDILNKYKIEHALHLMQFTNLSLSRISEQSGFHSLDHFSRTFQKQIGMLPSKYRKTL